MRPQQRLSMGWGAGVMYVSRGPYEPSSKENKKKTTHRTSLWSVRGSPLVPGGSGFICLSGSMKYRWAARLHNRRTLKIPSLTQDSALTPDIIRRLTSASPSPNNDDPTPSPPPHTPLVAWHWKLDILCNIWESFSFSVALNELVITRGRLNAGCFRG